MMIGLVKMPPVSVLCVQASERLPSDREDVPSCLANVHLSCCRAEKLCRRHAEQGHCVTQAPRVVTEVI